LHDEGVSLGFACTAGDAEFVTAAEPRMRRAVTSIVMSCGRLPAFAGSLDWTSFPFA